MPRIKLTERQYEALIYFDLDETTGVVLVADGSKYAIDYIDKDATYQALIDAGNAADGWCTYWRERKEPVLTRGSANDRKILFNLATKVLHVK